MGFNNNTNKIAYVAVGNIWRDIFLERGVLKAIDSDKYFRVMVQKRHKCNRNRKLHKTRETNDETLTFLSLIHISCSVHCTL